MCARCGVGMLPVRLGLFFFFFFFFNDTATTEIYTLSLHDALPIWEPARSAAGAGRRHPLPCESMFDCTSWQGPGQHTMSSLATQLWPPETPQPALGAPQTKTPHPRGCVPFTMRRDGGGGQVTR